MRFSPKRTQSVAVLITCAVAIILLFVFISYRIRQRVASDSADALLRRADELAWNDNWFAAAPLYGQAEIKFAAEGNRAKALYAQVSQIPARAESVSLASTIFVLTQDLNRPEAADSETRLRILKVRGIIENNYDAGMARRTWQDVADLATRQGHLLLASRALGEQGIAAYLSGDTTTAKRQVLAAWGVSRVFRDTAAHVRYASLYGAGLVEMHRYNEGLIALDEAINTAKSHPAVAYPAVAVSSKIDALRGLRRYQDALDLANQALAEIPSPTLKGHYYQILTSRATVYEDVGHWNDAIGDFNQALAYATQLDYWRGVTQVGGELAEAYEHQHKLKKALSAVDEAIAANRRISDELYFVPRDLAIKARILGELGQPDQADALSPNVERLLLTEMGEVYAGYFVSMCSRHKYDAALGVLEEARGRIEAQALEHHEYSQARPPTPAERHLTDLNIALLSTSDQRQRQELADQIYRAELMLDQHSLASDAIEHPVALRQLQSLLGDDEVLVEYVLADPHSYALAVTRTTARAYELASREAIEADANLYRAGIRQRRVNSALGDSLFQQLFGRIAEFQNHSTLILVPDGDLHLLPFGAIPDNGSPLVETRTIAICPSATVFSILRSKQEKEIDPPLPYVGVAAWVKKTGFEGPFRAFSGATGASLQPLPESRNEVETIAADLPKPSTVLLGADATETRFKRLPLAQYNVMHLALHGYVDTEYPDRSALIFAPEKNGPDDGMLQVREIEKLPLNARLVTLSACDTGVGPVGVDGVDNIVNAFIEAGAETVISTLWELEDHSTEHLMAAFYARLGNGEAKGEALRDAQRQLIKEGLQPYYWASFQLVGDPNGTI